MLCEHDFNSDVFLLDFQHARFYNNPDIEVLMFEAGYFARLCRKQVPTETINEWLDKLLSAIGIDDDARKQKMTDRFSYYFNTTLSRKERKKMS